MKYGVIFNVMSKGVRGMIDDMDESALTMQGLSLTNQQFVICNKAMKDLAPN